MEDFRGHSHHLPCASKASHIYMVPAICVNTCIRTLNTEMGSVIIASPPWVVGWKWACWAWRLIMESFVNHGGCLDGRFNAIMPEVIIKYLSTNTDQPLTTISLIIHLIATMLYLKSGVSKSGVPHNPAQPRTTPQSLKTISAKMWFLQYLPCKQCIQEQHFAFGWPPQQQKIDKSQPRNLKKTISVKMWFLQYLPCKNCIRERHFASGWPPQHQTNYKNQPHNL